MKKLLSLLFLFSAVCAVHGADRKIITVMDFETSGVSRQEMTLFVDYISSTVSDYEQYQLIDRRQRQIILDEAAFSNSGCVDESCAIEIGQLLSAQEMIVGSLGSIGSLYILNIKLIDVKTGATIKDVSAKYNTIEDLVNESDLVVAGLVEGSSPEMRVEEAVPIVRDSNLAIQKIDARQYSWNNQIFKRNFFWGDHTKMVEAVITFHDDPALREIGTRYTREVKRHRLFSMIGSSGALVMLLAGKQMMDDPDSESKGTSMLVGSLVFSGWGFFESILAGKPPAEFIAYYNANGPF